MSILSDFEDRIANAVEGFFASAFRSPVQPAEIAKELGRRMDKGRTIGIDKVYGPNLYTVVLSPDDDERFGGFLSTLAGELSTYLSAYANERQYDLTSKPIVRFVVDPELRLGRFETYAELVSTDDIHEPAEEAQARFVAAPYERAPATRTFATVSISGNAHDVVLTGERMIVGRLAECDITLEDSNVSRQHLAFEPEGAGWAVEDLDSTNGTLVNGTPIGRMRLQHGDVIQVGATELVFHDPRR